MNVVLTNEEPTKSHPIDVKAGYHVTFIQFSIGYADRIHIQLSYAVEDGNNKISPYNPIEIPFDSAFENSKTGFIEFKPPFDLKGTPGSIRLWFKAESPNGVKFTVNINFEAK
jgi:hypothetical protein